MATLTVMQSTRPARAHAGQQTPKTARSLAISGSSKASHQSTVQARQSVTDSASVRLTRRGRLAVSIASAFLMAMAAAAVVTLATSTDVQASSTTVSYTVQPGDTLWAIAGRINPGADRRDTVATLLRLNPAASGSLTAGESLEVPQ